MRPRRAAHLDAAVREAHEVVGLYGDPDSSWGIAVDLGVRDPDPDQATERLARLCAVHAHLGAAPTVEVVRVEDWSTRRAELATVGYGAGALLRVAIRQDGRRLAVGAHHGAVDGLGLVAVAGAALGEPLQSSARGIGDRRSPTGFLRSSLRRLAEAVVDPPPRFRGRGEPGSREDLSEVRRPHVSRGTAHLAVAAAAVFGDRGHRGVPLIVVGASRRLGTLPVADRQTAYVRLRVPVGATPTEVRRSLVTADPEPDFPTTSAGGIGPRVTHLLRHRLGATAVLSNLGRIDGPIDSIAMFPACSGPRAVAIGLGSTASSTTLSLRTRRSEFGEDEHAHLLTDLADRFFG
jgi:hypothetical protein